MAWLYDQIRKGIEESYSKTELTKEQLLERCIQLEMASHSFWLTFGALDDKAWRGTTVHSPLFPFHGDDMDFPEVLYFNKETEKLDKKTVSEETLNTDFCTADSFCIMHPDKINNDTTLFTVTQSEMASTVYRGYVFMRDIRLLNEIKGKPLDHYRSTESSAIAILRPADSESVEITKEMELHNSNTTQGSADDNREKLNEINGLTPT